MYAVLGNLTFFVLESPTSFESTHQWTYAKQDVVEALPRLQWMARDLEEIELDFIFHYSFTSPKRQLDALLTMANTHQANPLVFSNGTHRGYFVIKQINEIIQLQASDGTVASVEAKVTLLEWALGADFNPLTPPQTAAPGLATTAPSQVISTLQPFPPSTQTIPTLQPFPTAASPNTFPIIPGTYDPNAPSNTLPLASIAALGGLPANYTAPSYNAPGASALASIFPTAGSAGVSPSSVSPSTIVREPN
jgi:phage protein U